MTKYETVVGLEVHCELNTQSKIFCTCTTAFGGEENTHVCPICTGMPGMLPVQNKAVVESGMLAGLATHGEIPKLMRNDRKHYFYPDLAKGFQTSQSDMPVSVGGYVTIDLPDGGTKDIRLHHIHFEEDAGKLFHEPWGETRVDLNRSGVPLLEIVSEPDMRSSAEAKAFVETLREILMYIGVSDCRMEEGSLRCDVNVSVRPEGQAEYGVRTEMKNLNSFRSVVRAVEFESKRQMKELESGGVIRRETLRWDDGKGIAYPMRSKEDADDYLYFPEPDLPAIVVDDAWVQQIRERLPELPRPRRARLIREYNLPEYDAQIITATRHLAELFENTVKLGAEPKTASNYLMSDVLRILNDRGMEASQIPFGATELYELISMVEAGSISRSVGSKIMDYLFDGEGSPKEIADKRGLAQVSDEGAIRDLCIEAMELAPKAVADYRNGNKKALTSLVGRVMKLSRGKANPGLVNALLTELLEER